MRPSFQKRFDPANAADLQKLRMGQHAGHFENFFHPVVIAQFKMLGEISDALMTGNQLFFRTKHAFALEKNLSGQRLHQPCYDLQQSSFAGTRSACLLVSHDPGDLLSWADEVLVLREGRVVQQGSPVNIYKNPADEYTAGLFGSFNPMTVALLKVFEAFSELPLGEALYVRPEQFRIVGKGEGAEGKIKEVRFMGWYQELTVEVNGTSVIVHSQPGARTEGEVIYLSL